ncbi:MAG TPA: TetR/AcrR family transcriptional regulator [Candidatus Intestinimonas stercoravium]|nr:TetR/AcrR family transcriptional regulator [Candidatus Intestinimonas stercoravium]
MTIKKQMIAGKLVELLEHKPVDKITVKELVAACGISRQGFYYHFQDIMDVVEWITAQALQRAVEVSLAADSPQDALKNVILSLMNNRKLIYHLMASQRRSEIERLLVQAMRTYLEKVLRAKARGLPIRPGDLEAAINFYSYGLVGMLMEDLMKEVDVDALADQLCRLLTGDIWGLAQPS